MFLWCRVCIVVEVIYDEGVAIGRNVDVELEKKGNYAARSRRISRQRKKNVAFIVDEV